MNLKKKREVVILSTNEKVNYPFFKRKGNSNLLNFVDKTTKLIADIDTAQHIYFLSDEPIKEGDWCIRVNPDGSIVGNSFKADSSVALSQNNKRFKKIVSATDKSLGLPEPPPAFIERYAEAWNSGNKITHVMLDYWPSEIDINSQQPLEGDIIPERLKVDKNNYITITKVKDSWTKNELPIKDLKELLVYLKADAISIIPKELISRLNNWTEQNL